jgi:glutamyl-tRNA synthetase
MNGQHLHQLDPTELLRRVEPWLRADGLLKHIGGDEGPAPEAVLALVQERVETLADLPEAIRYFYVRPSVFDPAGVRRHFQPSAAPLLRAAAGRILALEPFSEHSLEVAYRALAEELSVKAAVLIHPTRLALTGRTVGPSLFALASLLGRQECVARVFDAAERIESGAFSM